MSTRTGLGKYLSYGVEVTPGTAVTTTRFVPLIDSTLRATTERIISAATIPGEYLVTDDQVRPGAVVVEGDIGHELYASGQAFLWRHILGTAAVTTGAGPYTHTFTGLASMDGDSLTVQVVRPDVGGTNRAFTAAGCKIASAQVACSVGEAATLGLSVVGMSMVTNVAAASPSYATSSTKPLVFREGSLTVGGSSVSVSEATLDITNNLNADRRFLGQATTSQPLEVDRKEITLTASAEFVDLTHYAAYVAGTTPVACVLAFTDGTNSTTITFDGYYDEGATPEESGRDIVKQPLTFKASNDADVSVVVVNQDATA